MLRGNGNIGVHGVVGLATLWIASRVAWYLETVRKQPLRVATIDS